MRVGLIYFTKNGEEVTNKIIKIKGIEFVVFDKKIQTAKEFVQEYFCLDAIIFVAAVGIGVRLIAPLISTKDLDPAVIIIDELALYVIPILSGHIGGANALATSLAKELGAIPIVTTATDLNGVFAVDVWSTKLNCAILDISLIKYVSSALLRGDRVGLVSKFPIIGDLPKGVFVGSGEDIGIFVSTTRTSQPFKITLQVIPKITTLGVGCKKDTDNKAFEEYLLNTLKEQDISIKSLRQITSIDLKKDEACIKLFCEKYHVAFHTFSAIELAAVKGEFTKSEFVKMTTGVDNVCERSAVLGSGGGEILLKKQSKDGMTIAIAAENWRCKF